MGTGTCLGAAVGFIREGEELTRIGRLGAVGFLGAPRQAAKFQALREKLLPRA